MTRKVREEQWREMCATCEQSLREMLRGTDAKYRRKAAKLILQGARRDPPMVSAEAVAEAKLVLAREEVVRVTTVTVNEGRGGFTPTGARTIPQGAPTATR